MKDCPDCQIREVASRLLGTSPLSYPHDVTVYEGTGNNGNWVMKPVNYVGHDPRTNRVIVAVDK